MSGRTRVGLLFGGRSVEHEVSVVSARGVAASLDAERFEMVPLGICGDGRWLPPVESARILASDRQRVEAPAHATERCVADPGSGGLLRVGGRSAPETIRLDVVFSVAHGWGGEDGRIQGLLDLAGIPCVGAGVLGSAVGMDKQISKALFQERGLPVAPWRALRRDEWRRDRAGAERGLVEALGLPMFAKPANGGSSVGISKVHTADELPAALQVAFAHDHKVVVEKGLDVREIECAVLGNERPEASIAGEIIPSREFYDYAAKYEDATSKLVIPAAIDGKTTETIRALALEAFRALDLAGMARVDFFLEKGAGGRIFLNEVNTLPGFTPISMYPKLWDATGVPYRELLTRLIDLARERSATERERALRHEV